MRHALRAHPGSRIAAGTVVEAEVTRRRALLSLRYFVTGNDLLIPSQTAPTRADELWRHTCFEAFVRATSGAGYYELNFAASTQWAVYRFTGYRTGMSVVEEIETPELRIRSDSGRFELQALVRSDGLRDLPFDSPWQVGLSAVLEDVEGHLSYWALAHPAGKADFHHPDCFSLALPAA